MNPQNSNSSLALALTELGEASGIQGSEEFVALAAAAEPADSQPLQTAFRLVTHFNRHEDLTAAFVDVLPDTLDLCESQFGFLAEICIGHSGLPYLQSHAVSNAHAGWPGGPILSGLQFHNLNTLNGAIITSGKPVLSNDPPNDPRSGGLPAGHRHLDSYLGLPFHFQGELVGALAVANRQPGYDEALVEFLRPFSLACSLVIGAWRSGPGVPRPH
ncbi:MAG: GAF domain-containing protein [Planctomycetota bacterium]|nr:GAF domain-containing protein [Planctomycetota bacterium]MDA1139407.1 GAF domain-containing protein [Planctomycetota bacterium]